MGQMQCCDWLICRSTLSVFANCGANVIDGSEKQNKRNVEVILTLNWTIEAIVTFTDTRKIQMASTGFEPTTSAMPVQCSVN